MTTKSLVTTLTVVLVLGTTALTEETRAQRTRPDCPPSGTNLRAAFAAGQLTAEEAREFGIVDKVFERRDVDSEAEA